MIDTTSAVILVRLLCRGERVRQNDFVSLTAVRRCLVEHIPGRVKGGYMAMALRTYGGDAPRQGERQLANTRDLRHAISANPISNGLAERLRGS